MGPIGAAGTTLGPSAVPALALVQVLTAAGPAPGDSALPGSLAVVARAPDGTLGATWSPSPVVVEFGSTEHLDTKVLAARSLLAQIAPGAAAAIDVRVVDAPVLTNGANRTTVSTTQRG